MKQECIPVGCVPAAHWPYAGVCFRGGCLPPGGGVCVCSQGVGGGGVFSQGGVCSQGVGEGGVCSGGHVCPWGRCLLRGVSAPGGGVCSGGCLLLGGRGGGCLLPGGHVCSQGGCLLQGGGVCSQGSCLFRGVCLPPGGVCSGGVCLLQGVGVSAPGGCLLWGWGIPACTEADTPLVNRTTDRCKIITLATTSLRPVIIHSEIRFQKKRKIYVYTLEKNRSTQSFTDQIWLQ